MGDESEYLRNELYSKVKTDSRIFEFLQDGSLDGIWYWDLEKPDNEWLSARFKRVFGYDDDEVPNTSAWWQANIHPDDLKVATENFERHVQDPHSPYDQIVRYRHKDGSTVWVRCRGLVIRDESGRPTRMLGAHTDVTALKRSEVALRRANQDLEQFAYAASHDLREPLRMVSAFLERLDDTLGSKLDERSKKYVHFARDGAVRMQALLDGLLAYTRVTAAEHPMTPVETTGIVDDVVRDLKVAIEESKAVVRYGALPSVIADRHHLRLVFQNLISNAIKFHRGQPPEIDVESKMLESGRCEIAVRDNGIGFDSKFVDRVFGVFERLHAPDEFPGAGMGLAIAKRVVERCGGTIRVQSTVGVGSTFFVTFRAA